MLVEAEINAEEDAKKRELVDTKNQADSLVYQARKQVSESADELREELKSSVEKAIVELEETSKTDDLAKIKASMDNLQKQLMEIGSAMYSQQTENPEKTSGTKETSLENADVIDADFTSQK